MSLSLTVLLKNFVNENDHTHRDKTRVQMPAKMFPHLKLLCLLFMGPTLGFDTKAKKQFLDQIWCFFYNKTKIMTILFIVKYEKITLFDEFLVLLGPIISRFFACSNEEKNKQKQLRVHALVLSLCYFLKPRQAVRANGQSS